MTTTSVILAFLATVGIPLLGYLLKLWMEAKDNNKLTPAERKENEITKAVVTHDADTVNALINDRLHNSKIQDNHK